MDVVVGLVTGEEREGWLDSFDPSSPTLVLASSEARPPGDYAFRLATQDLAYVGFATEPPALGSRRSSSVQERFRIHVCGGRTFLVRCEAGEMQDPLGFFAVSLDEETRFSCLYFWSHAINARESDRPLGSILVQDGAVEERDLLRGVEIQSRERLSLGSILVEQKQLAPEALQKASEMVRQKRMRLGQILLGAGLITPQALELALLEQRKRGSNRLGLILVGLGLISESTLAAALAEKFMLPFVDLEEVDPQPQAVREVGIELMQRHQIFPIRSDATSITLALSDPLAVDAIDELRFRVRKRIHEVVATVSQVREFIERASGEDKASNRDVERILREFKDSDLNLVAPPDEEKVDLNVTNSTVVKLANHLIADAMRRGASDVHVEPNGSERDTVVRFRVDGVCSIYQQIPPGLRRSLVARLKIISGMDIAERRKPQDGRIRFRLGDQTFDLRVVSLPTGDGDEDVVLRILDTSRTPSLDTIDLHERNRRVLGEMLERPHGLILCVGPTGSGKTTTLHAMLGHLNSVDRKIWTAEDPIEINQPGLRQLQVRPRIGLTFAAALRSFLRADPDVIMLGEMRDEETASTALDASLTGHLVLSTLHTNSAAETVTRLVEIGLEPFSFAGALLGVLAQRLVRGLCPDCRKQHPPTQSERERITAELGEGALDAQLASDDTPLMLWRAEGCESCRSTGYAGRIPVQELLVADAGLRRAIERRASSAEITQLAKDGGMTTLVQDGLRKAVAGRTDLAQVLAACRA